MKGFELIEPLYQQVCDVILSRQHPITGLLPASTSVNVHGDYQDAWVRDNVYSIQCAWVLSLACRGHGQMHRFDQLSQATIKLMRGLLQSMMHQADKVERFKHTQRGSDALHAKYSTETGRTVVADDAWGHLQIDATSLYLLSLAQMTTSGLRIITTRDEVDFIQNLVYYIATAYRTPDYGIWERGNKINDGKMEINASSLGMAKSALLSMDGLNLFGVDGPEEAVVHVIGDAISHARNALTTLLPRESLSKEVDGALLSVIGYPAFAVGDPKKVERTKRKIREKLAGRYGCKRFLLDGHQTVLEDTSRFHYEHSELVNFEHIESEWPLFFCYQYINALFERDAQEARELRSRLEALMVEKGGVGLLPELYFVPKGSIEAEKKQPGSQTREPNDNLPLVWAQSLYLVGRMIEDELVDLSTVDAVDLRHRRTRLNDAQMALVVLAEDEGVKATLAEAGVIAETPQDIEPCLVISAPQLVDAFAQVGSNEALGLSGRPRRSLQSLSTAQTYSINKQRYLCLSWLQGRETDYRLYDPALLSELLSQEVEYTLKHWFYPEVAVFTFLVTAEMLQSERIGVLMETLRTLQLRAHSMRVGYASARLALRASRTTALSIDGFEGDSFVIRKLSEPHSLSEELRLRMVRLTREPMPQLIREGMEEHFGGEQAEMLYLYSQSLQRGNWWLARYCFALLGRHHGDVGEALTGLMARHIRLVVGPDREKALVVDADTHDGRSFHQMESHLDDSVESVLVQEMLLALGTLVRTDPSLFSGVRTIETHSFMAALVSDEDQTLEVAGRELVDRLGTLSPGELLRRVRELLGSQRALYRKDVEMDFALAGEGRLGNSKQLQRDTAMNTDWLEWRYARGLVPRFDKAFQKAIWHALGSCPAIEFSDGNPGEGRLDSERVRGSMTEGEESFAQLLDGLMGDVHPPHYRTACAEVLLAIARVCAEDDSYRFEKPLSLVAILEEATQRWGEKTRASKQELSAFLELSPETLQYWFSQILHAMLVAPSTKPG